MSERDLVAALRVAITRADPSWISQPSHLRRRLDEELGPDAREHRAQVHQLVVAAEERVPMRLKRNGWSPTERRELSHLLVATRGWTPEASDWAVATWAAALGLSDDRPELVEPVARPRVDHVAAATEMPSESIPAATELPAPQFPAPTAVPPQFAVVATELPSELASALPAEAAKLPTRGTTKSTRKASKFLGEELDVAYEARGGISPTFMLIVLVLLAVAFFASPAVSAALWLVIAIIFFATMFWPARVIAVKGNDVWLLSKTRFSYFPKPKRVLAKGTRDDVEFASGFPIPSVRFAGERLWLFMGASTAARLLPTGQSQPRAIDQ